MSDIKKDSDGNGYIVNGEKESRAQTIKEVEKEEHEGYHILHRNGKKFVRANPDGSKKNNVDR